MLIPSVSLSEGRCTEHIDGIMFCSDPQPQIGLRMGKAIRLDNIQVQGIAARNVFVFLEPATEVGLEPGQSPEGFLRELTKTQRNTWDIAHKTKTITHSEVMTNSGWPVIFTTISPPWSLWRETGSSWHYSSALVCETALLIEQKGDEKTSAEDMQAIAEHILSMIQSPVVC